MFFSGHETQQAAITVAQTQTQSLSEVSLDEFAFNRADDISTIYSSVLIHCYLSYTYK